MQINIIVMYFYFGFVLGVIFFFTPDHFGRKPTLVFTMSTSLIAYTVLLHVPSLTAKSIAFFVMGFMHLKSSLSFIYC
jgi:MFS family permease